MDAALAHGKLSSGEAQKLAGRLMWATQHLFYRCALSLPHSILLCSFCSHNRIGRAMIKAIYEQKKSRNGEICMRLRIALLWWRRVLTQKIAEVSPWDDTTRPPCRLLVDAASTPPCCAAVLFADGAIKYTVWVPPAELLAKLEERSDNQIGSLARLALLL